MKTVGTFSLILILLIRFCLEGLRKLAVYGTKTPYIKK